MKVRVTYTIDIDAEGWAAEFGVEPHEVRDDIKNQITDCIITLLKDRGLLVIKEKS